MIGASPRQVDLLRLIAQAEDESRPAPTYRELLDMLEVTSTYAVACLIRGLHKKDLLQPGQPNGARQLRLSEAGWAELGVGPERRAARRLSAAAAKHAQDLARAAYHEAVRAFYPACIEGAVLDEAFDAWWKARAEPTQALGGDQ